MEILKRSPMLAVLSALVAGLAMYDRAGVIAFAVIVPAVFVGVMFLSYECELPEQWNIFAFTLIFTLICSWRMYAVISSPPPENHIFISETGTVTDIRQWGRIYAAEIDTDKRGKYVAFLHFAELTRGMRIRFDGATSTFRPSRGNFNESRFWRARNVQGRMTLHNPEELPPKFSLALMRHKLSRKLSIYTPNLTGAYLKAAWLGERDQELTRKHRIWGTSHLLAVSGFHVGIIVMCAMLFFGHDALTLSFIMWAYILLTGAAPSAMRAGLMVQAGLLAKMIHRPVNAVNSVCLAGVILLICSPFLFWDIGWRLSVISALLISAMFQGGCSWFMISPAVWLVTFPQAAYTFGSVPAVGVLLNLFAPVYFSFAFSIASFGAVLRLAGFPLSKYFMLAVEGIFILWERVADIAAGLIPYSIGWNYVMAWIGCGILVFFVCRELELAPLRIATAVSVVGFVAFMAFL